MARDESPPFERGYTYFNGGTIDPTDPLGLGGINLEGKEYVFEVNSQDNPTPADPSGRPVRVKVVRNKSTIALKPKRIVTYRVNADSPLETAVDAYTVGAASIPAGVVDEFLPPAGVPVNDLFYIVIDGPTVVTTVDTGLVNTAIGNRVVPGTGTGGTTADAGKLNGYPASPVFTDAQSSVGRADQAVTTVTTDCKVVVHISKR